MKRKTPANIVVFCYAGFRIYSDRHIANQLQFRLTNKSKQKNISSTLEFLSASVPADVTQNISTAESPNVVSNPDEDHGNCQPQKCLI